jgi:hypothetical protein
VEHLYWMFFSQKKNFVVATLRKDRHNKEEKKKREVGSIFC